MLQFVRHRSFVPLPLLLVDCQFGHQARIPPLVDPIFVRFAQEKKGDKDCLLLNPTIGVDGWRKELKDAAAPVQNERP